MAGAPAPQPLSSVLTTGFLGIALVLAISAAIVAWAHAAGADHHFFTGWVGIAFMAATPTQALIGLLWHNSLPKAVASKSQPVAGIGFLVITIAAGAIITLILANTVGGGHGATPMLIQYTILTIVVTLWMLPVMQCWPFTLISKDPFVFGILALIGCYIIAYIIWIIFYDYSMLAGAPIYFEDIAPSGIFGMWTATTFAVTVAATIICHAHFDFQPIDKLAGGKGQPIRGIVGTIYILIVAFVIRWFFTSVIGMEQVDYLVQVPVCMLFGTFLVNNMMQFALFPETPQPLKGFYKLGLTVIAALIVYRLYSWAETLYIGEALPSGPTGGWEHELWVATAMLGITFPVIFVVSGFFAFWPIKRAAKEAPASEEASAE